MIRGIVSSSLVGFGQRGFCGSFACCCFPLQSPGSPRGGNPLKIGKNYKIPLPGPTPENGEKLPKNYKKYSENTFFEFYGNFFPIFGVWTGEGSFVTFPIFREFPPRGFRGSVRGKTNRKESLRKHCGDFAEVCKIRVIASGKCAAILRKS